MICRIGSINIHIISGTAIVIAFLLIVNEWMMLLVVLTAMIIHESGHIIMAKCLDINVESIDIMPFGGVLHMASFYELSLKDDVALCLAGPMANLILAMFCSVIINLGLLTNEFIEMLMTISFGLCLFNLFPALPLDGGRMFRSVMALSMPIKKAGNISAVVGYMLGAGLSVLGMYLAVTGEYNIMLFIISYFVIVGTKEEHKNVAYVLMKNISRKNQTLLRVGLIENTQLTVYGNIQISKVLKSFSIGKLHHVTVVDDKMSVIGYLDEKEIIEGATKQGAHIKVATLLK